jgi:hypothetical protein
MPTFPQNRVWHAKPRLRASHAIQENEGCPEKGRITKETYLFTGKAQFSTECDEQIKPSKFTQEQYQTCVAKLRQAGMSDDELTLFNYFNGLSKSHFQG